MIRMLTYVGGACVLTLGLIGACTSEETESTPPNPTTTTTTSTTSSSSTTSSVGGGTTTTTTSGSGGSTPLTCDVEFTNIEGECDLLAQDCPVGEVCLISGSPLTASCGPPQSGLKPVGASCTSTSECSGSLNCIDDHCTPVCCPSSDEPCEGGRCDIHVNYGNDMWAMECSYSLTCEIFAHTCPEGEDCHVANFETALAVCDEPSDSYVAEGEPCYYRNDCGDSQLCNRSAPDVDPDAGVDGRCRYLCSVANWESAEVGSGGCPDGQSCHDINVEAMPDIGRCY